MKKTLLILTLVLGLISFNDASAQDNEIGIRAGWNTSGTFASGNQIEKNIPNFYAGIFHNKKIAPTLALHTGLEYLQNGWKSDDDNYRRVHTLSGPIGLRVKLGPLFAIGGAAINLNLSEQNEGDFAKDTPKNDAFDLPLFACLGVKIAIVTIEARYNWGMIETNDLGYKNQYFQIGAGISL